MSRLPTCLRYFWTLQIPKINTTSLPKLQDSSMLKFCMIPPLSPLPLSLLLHYLRATPSQSTTFPSSTRTSSHLLRKSSPPVCPNSILNFFGRISTRKYVQPSLPSCSPTLSPIPTDHGRIWVPILALRFLEALQKACWIYFPTLMESSSSIQTPLSFCAGIQQRKSGKLDLKRSKSKQLTSVRLLNLSSKP